MLRRTHSWGDAIEYAVSPTVRAPAAKEPASAVADTDPADDTPVAAIGYRSLVADLEPGDEVLLNASALLRGLGTGGFAFIVAAPGRLPADRPARPGHIVKARYTPMQQLLLAVDEQESPFHGAMLTGAAAAGDLEGMPILVADLHSALAPILVGMRTVAPSLRIAYVMSDGGALPAAFSRSLAHLVELGWLATTITVGQAFGGTHEAVTLHSGLLAARHVLGAEVAIVIQGPGNVGTGTPFGFTGLAAGEALNAVHVLGGRGVGALRVSDADRRDRHYGISHHARTAFGRIVLGEATLVVPDLPGPFGDLVHQQALELAASARGRISLAVEPVDGLGEALHAAPVGFSTMGRGLDADPAYFLAQAAAGRHTARLATGGTGTPRGSDVSGRRPGRRRRSASPPA